ncbi:MAG TPA: hypothetical protein VG275_06860 [Solirubrobacteraceae bacterium]|jgi:hypothetical protein|nr:hypothetical protein [Solirubrobacteraceae bacterium]
MPANLGTAADPRFRPGAYITNGIELYCVLGERSEPAQLPKGAPIVKLDAEDCATGLIAELDLELVRRGCRLVQARSAR